MTSRGDGTTSLWTTTTAQRVLGVRLSPMIAAAAMALSSLSVVTNANRLRRFTPPRPFLTTLGRQPPTPPWRSEATTKGRKTCPKPKRSPTQCAE